MTMADLPAPCLTRGGSIALRAAFAISSTGDWIYKFAVPTLVVRLTGSPVDTAFAYVLEFIPYVIVGPVAGVAADRFPRRRMMIACDTGSCLLALAIAGLVQLGRPPIAALYACALALSCARPLYFPAFQAFLVEMTGEKDRPRLNSWFAATDSLLTFAGPALGISIVATAGVPVGTVVDAASFAVSASLVATIAYRRLPRPQRGARGWMAGVLHDVGTGLRTISITRSILAAVILLTLANLAAFLVEGNLVYVLLHLEHYPQIVLGVVFSAQGLGGIGGAMAAPRLLPRYQVGRLLIAGIALSAVALTIQAIAPRLPMIAAGQALEGCGATLVVVCWYTTVQRLIPEPVIGRFVSVVRAVGYATLPAGALLGAWLLAVSAGSRVLFGCAAILQLGILLGSIWSPLIRIGQEETAGGAATGHSAAAG